MRLLLAATIVALLPAGPAIAFNDAPQTANVEDKKKARLICKTSDQIGSRLRKNKSCRTAKEWADMALQTQEKTRDYQRVGLPSEPTDPIGK